MIIINPAGNPQDIVNEKELANLLSKPGWRKATKDEAQQYFDRINALIERNKAGKAPMEIHLRTVQRGPNGYGMSRDILIEEFRRLGVAMPEQFKDQKIGLLYGYPYGLTQMRTDVRLLMTMFESDKIPEEWPDYLAIANEIIVPSTWCKKVFAKSGIETTVIPLGYNDRIFKFIDRPVPMDEAKDFTFIHYNSFNIRKGFNEVLQAFDQEFKHNEPVKLILKTISSKPPLPLPKSIYPNIEVIAEEYSETQLFNLLRRANCMVYPSRGEGFGITPLEAMATGMPAIVPNAHGISEYFDPDYMLEVKVAKTCPGLYNRFRGQDTGEMVVCDVDDLRRQMRYAYNHQKEMKALGAKAAGYVTRWNYRATAEKLVEVFKKWHNAEVIKRADAKFLPVEVL